MLPKLGKGKYVDVVRKGEIIEINYHDKGRTGGSGKIIRLIPYQPNHGVMIETWVNGKCTGRTCDDFRSLFKD